MNKFDYKTICVHIDALEKELTMYGQSGWKLINSFVNPFDKSKIIAILEKEV